MARPPKAEGRTTRQDILDAALELFAQNGFFGTSMRQIARQVGVRESALYHHFDSKEAMLAALAKELGLDKVNRLAELDLTAMLEAMKPKELLKQMLTVLAAEWATPRERKAMRFIVSEAPRLAEHGVADPAAMFAIGRKKVASFLAALIKRKAIKPVDPHSAALALMAPMGVLRLMYLVMPAGEPDVKTFMAEVERHLDFFWQSVSN